MARITRSKYSLRLKRQPYSKDEKELLKDFVKKELEVSEIAKEISHALPVGTHLMKLNGILYIITVAAGTAELSAELGESSGGDTATID